MRRLAASLIFIAALAGCEKGGHNVAVLAPSTNPIAVVADLQPDSPDNVVFRAQERLSALSGVQSEFERWRIVVRLENERDVERVITLLSTAAGVTRVVRCPCADNEGLSTRSAPG
ncbi:MAG: hypothetical protein H0W70_14470 [Actinobacteria bacterium]|nr:hypothetical protein [Actinomycetota bacterium]